MKKILFLICTLTAINAVSQENLINTNYADSGTLYFDLPPNAGGFSETPLCQLRDKRVVIAFQLYDSVTKMRTINVIFYDENGNLITDGGLDDGIRLKLPFSNLIRYNNFIEAVTEQPDGKILIVGRDITSLLENTAYLIRCLPDGSADTSFGENGITKQVFYGEIQDFRGLEIRMARSIALDSRQNILIGVSYVCECTDDTVMILRYLPTGMPDPTFGSGGILRVNSGNEEYGGGINQLAVTNNDKILTLGGDGNIPEQFLNHFAVKRFNEDGTPDMSFGVQGKSFVQAQDRYQNYGAVYMRIDSKDRIVIGQYYIKNIFRSFYSFGVMRLNENGFMDAGFGDNGVVLIDYSDSSFATDPFFRADMELQENDKIVLGATLSNVSLNPTVYDAIVYRFNEDGTKDAGFANGGEYRYDFIGVVDTVDTRDYLDNIEIRKNGDILLSGVYYSINDNARSIYYTNYFRLLNGEPTRLPWAVRIRRWIRNHILHFTDNEPNPATAYYTIAKSTNGSFTEIARLPRNHSGAYQYALPTANVTTSYSVTAMQSNGEPVSSFQITDAATETAKSSIRLWPNPVGNIVNIEAGFTIQTVEILHIQSGLMQRVSGNHTQQMKIPADKLQPGMYSITVTGYNGERVQEKFVKE